jgi:S1-C subfamily serine protease
MGKIKYVFISILVIIGLLLSAGCSTHIEQGSSPLPSAPTETSPASISSEPIEPNWEAFYVDNELGLRLHANNEVIKEVAPAVVAIFTETIARDFFLQPYPQRGAGTGVIIDPKGYIVTNSHVVRGANKVEVTLNDGRSFKAANIVCDPWTDLAVVKIEAKNLHAAHFLNNPLKQLKVGDEVIAIGNALALPGGPTVTKGIVSYLGRSIQVQIRGYTIELHDLIQTDAAINPGNSGGPLVNMAAQVVGINTAIAQAENIGFAISTDTLLPMVRELVKKGYIQHPWLGVSMTTVTPAIKSQYQLKAETGTFILEVVEGSPAKRAGLEPGDVITRFAGQEITGAEELRQIIQRRRVGDRVEITFYRGVERRATSAVLAQRPPP